MAAYAYPFVSRKTAHRGHSLDIIYQNHQASTLGFARCWILWATWLGTPAQQPSAAERNLRLWHGSCSLYPAEHTSSHVAHHRRRSRPSHGGHHLLCQCTLQETHRARWTGTKHPCCVSLHLVDNLITYPNTVSLTNATLRRSHAHRWKEGNSGVT